MIAGRDRSESDRDDERRGDRACDPGREEEQALLNDQSDDCRQSLDDERPKKDRSDPPRVADGTTQQQQSRPDDREDKDQGFDVLPLPIATWTDGIDVPSTFGSSPAAKRAAEPAMRA